MKSRVIWGFILTILIGLCPTNTFVSGLSLEELIEPEQSRALLAGEKPVSAQFKEPKPNLIPRHEVLSGIVDKLRRDLDPSVMVETLYLYNKPLYETLSNKEPLGAEEAWSAEEESRLYNGTLALSTLAGLQYYSASRGAMRIFYETSSVIDGPSTKKPLPDPVYPRPPAQLTIYARQKDSSFGDNIYQYDYFSTPGTMIFVQQNLTSLNYGIIPAIGKNKLHSVVSVMDAGNYLLVYMVSMSKAASIPGMKERIGNSFANRAEAVFRWFSNQADKAFRQ